jgi:hypothetical protein
MISEELSFWIDAGELLFDVDEETDAFLWVDDKTE